MLPIVDAWQMKVSTSIEQNGLRAQSTLTCAQHVGMQGVLHNYTPADVQVVQKSITWVLVTDCMHGYTNECSQVRRYVCMHLYMCIHMYICIHVDR